MHTRDDDSIIVYSFANANEFVSFVFFSPLLPTRAHAHPTHVSLNRPTPDIMIKPDGVQRGLIGEIIKRFEQKVRRRSS